MTDPNYYGLARALYTGTWSAGAGGQYPIVNSRELRGSLQYVSGNVGDRLTDITTQRVEYGMIVYVQNTYTNSSSTVINGGSYYQYIAVAGDAVRSIANNGIIPNNDANWSVFTAGGGGGAGATGPTGYIGQGSWIAKYVPAGDIVSGATGGYFQKIKNTNAFDSAVRSVQSINGPCFVSFSPNETTTDLVVALNNRSPSSYTPSAYQLAVTSNAAWSLTSAANALAYANSNSTPLVLSGGQITNYSVTDVFSIIYDGTSINFYYNGTLKASSPINQPVTNPLYLDANIKQQNGAVQNLVFGYAGAVGTPGTPGGPTGATGITGPTGPSGPLGFIVDPNISYQRDLVTYYDVDGPKAIRQYVTYANPVGGGQMFAVQLASFSPSFSVSTYTPNQNLYWDQPFTSFRVQVTNPSDYISQYISSVINNNIGIIDTSTTSLGQFVPPFTASAIVPDGGNAAIGGGTGWTQTFSTTNSGAQGLIRSKTNTLAGGSASATIQFRQVNNGAPEAAYGSQLLNISVNWATAGNSLSVAANTGNIFLKPYTNTTYTVGYYGSLTAPTHLVSRTGGTISSTTASGTLTYTTPINPFTSIFPTIGLNSTFTRPVGVSSNGRYSSTATIASEPSSASFDYPSFLIFTTSVAIVPDKTDIVNTAGNDFRTTGTPNNSRSLVTKLFNNQSSIGTSASAVDIGVPPFASGGLWFGVFAASDINLTKFGSGSGVLNASQTNNSSTVSRIPITLYDNINHPGLEVSYIMYGFTVNPLPGGAPTFVFASNS